jgi:hypothetical protein
MSIGGQVVRRSNAGTNPTARGATMKYLLLVCWDAETMNGQADPDPAETRDDESFPWLDDLQARGAWITGDQLAPPRRARSVRVRDGKPIVTDGPFAESKELISYAVYDVRSREEAIEWATRFVRLHQEHWAGWEGEADVQQVFEAPPSP